MIFYVLPCSLEMFRMLYHSVHVFFRRECARIRVESRKMTKHRKVILYLVLSNVTDNKIRLNYLTSEGLRMFYQLVAYLRQQLYLLPNLVLVATIYLEVPNN